MIPNTKSKRDHREWLWHVGGGSPSFWKHSFNLYGYTRVYVLFFHAKKIIFYHAKLRDPKTIIRTKNKLGQAGQLAMNKSLILLGLHSQPNIWSLVSTYS